VRLWSADILVAGRVVASADCRVWSCSQSVMSCLFFVLIRRPLGSTLFPYTTLFRSAGADRVVDRCAAGGLQVLARVDAERRERHLGREGDVGLAQGEPHGQLVDRLDRRQVAGVALRAALGALVEGDRLEVGLLGPVARLVVVAPARRGHEAERGEQGEPAGALP